MVFVSLKNVIYNIFLPTIYICAAFELLSNLQNEFLKETMTIATSGSPSLLYLKSSDSETVLRGCPLYDLTEKGIDFRCCYIVFCFYINHLLYVINFTWKNEILQFSQLNLEYGKGKEVAYNYSKIELEIAHSLISGKSIIGICL